MCVKDNSIPRHQPRFYFDSPYGAEANPFTKDILVMHACIEEKDR